MFPPAGSWAIAVGAPGREPAPGSGQCRVMDELDNPKRVLSPDKADPHTETRYLYLEFCVERGFDGKFTKPAE